VLIEIEDPADQQPLSSPGALELQWLAEGTAVEALRKLTFPEGAVHAFVHGEASTVRDVRRHLLVDRGLPREALSVSGYWKRSRTEEGWREDKAEWNRQAEQDLAA
jgi:NADPH-dependent ferric siderophore reductase